MFTLFIWLFFRDSDKTSIHSGCLIIIRTDLKLNAFLVRNERKLLKIEVKRPHLYQPIPVDTI